MLNARDNQFIKEINMLKDLLNMEMVRQLKDIKDNTHNGKEIRSLNDYTRKMNYLNAILDAVKQNNYDILTRTELDIGKFIEEIKNEFSGFKQTMEELERRIAPEEEIVEIPKFKTHSYYKEKAETNLEELFSLIEKELEKYKSVDSSMNLEKIKVQDYQYRKCVLYSSTLDSILTAILDDNPSYAEGSVANNIGELISYVRMNYSDYLEDLLWFYNIFMNRDQVKFIINKYNFPFTIESLEEDIHRPYQEMVKCFDKCIEEYTKTNEPSDILKERINDLRIVLHYIDFALS